MDLTAAKDSEIDHLLQRLLPGRVYVKDRGYACFKLFQAIHDIPSHFVCRIRDNSVYTVIEARTLSEEAQAAGILSDQIVWLGCADKRDELKQPVRLIKIKCKPHHKRSGHTGRGGPEQGEYLLIATNLMETPAEVVGLIFRKRWTVELFFRFFKHLLGCRHLLSHRTNGIEIQVYMAMSPRRPDRLVDRRQAHATNAGDDPVLLHRLGQPGGTGGSYRFAQKTGPVTRRATLVPPAT